MLALATEAVGLYSLAARSREAAAAETDRAERPGTRAGPSRRWRSCRRCWSQPRGPRAAFTLGVVLRGIGKADLAIPYFQNAIRVEPGARWCRF